MMFDNMKLGWGLVALGIVLLLLLTIIKLQVDEQSAFLCQVVSDDPTLSMESCPAHQNNTSWVILLGFALSFLVLASGLFIALSGKKGEGKETKQEQKEIEMDDLENEEKRIVLLLKEKQGSAYQSDLIKETEFSKVKMTRILDKLEGRGLLHRKRRGMTNIVLLK